MRRFTTFAALALTAYAPFAAADSNAPVPAGAYKVDKLHTSLTFRVSHLGFSSWTARFTEVDANLKFDPARLGASSVDVSVDPRSIEADNVPDSFLTTLAGEGWLDAAKYPKLTFISKSVEVTGPNTFRLNGELTLHGVTRPVTLAARYNGGYASHPYEANARVGFSATGSFKRSDFGVTAGLPAPGTTFGVGDEVSVILESEFAGPALQVAKR
jgi:polyisoprenoid-binding protein YceI